MPADTTDVRLRLRSSSDIVEAVPFLVGFQPENSLVVLSLRGKRSRVGLTARVDLPSLDEIDSCATAFVSYLKRDKAERALIVLYPPSEGPAYPVIAPLAEAMAVALERAGIEIGDIICVGEGRWWSLLCANDDCCPPEGTPIEQDQTSICAATMAVAGLVVLESRAELERTIEPVGGMRAAAMAYALRRFEAELVDRIAAGQGIVVRLESIASFLHAVGARLPESSTGHDVALGVDEAARLIVGLKDVRTRDVLIGWHDGARGQALRSLLVELVRLAMPPHDAPALTTLAWIAYLQGNGAFAGIAIDRALDADPDCRLAQLLDQALTNAVNPEVFRRGLAATSPRGSAP